MVLVHHTLGHDLPSSVFTERDGILAVAFAVNSARCFWRETPLHDVGIDGQIEYVNSDGKATGRLILVQVKSGERYFASATAENVMYIPDARHRTYWERAPLPVILVLHHPTKGSFWADARSQLRQGKNAINVRLADLFCADTVQLALAIDGPLPDRVLQPREIVLAMLKEKHHTNDLPLDVFDLFVHGLIDFRRSIYFGVDLAEDVGNSILAYRGSQFSVGWGADEYDFLRRYVLFLIEYDIARVDYDAFVRAWDGDQVVPRFITPLTRRGTEVCEYISSLDHAEGIRVIQDKLFKGMWAFEAVQRVPIVIQFKNQF
jgi:hypothetical protein